MNNYGDGVTESLSSHESISRRDQYEQKCNSVKNNKKLCGGGGGGGGGGRRAAVVQSVERTTRGEVVLGFDSRCGRPLPGWVGVSII